MSLIQNLRTLLAGIDGNQAPNKQTPPDEQYADGASNRTTFVGSAAQSMLRLLDHDEFYRTDTDPAALTNQRRKSGSNLPVSPKFRKIVNDLDVTRITNRLVACGLPWRQRTERGSRRNNVEDLARFLNFRYPDRYLIWNLTSKHTVCILISLHGVLTSDLTWQRRNMTPRRSTTRSSRSRWCETHIYP